MGYDNEMFEAYQEPIVVAAEDKHFQAFQLAKSPLPFLVLFEWWHFSSLATINVAVRTSCCEARVWKKWHSFAQNKFYFCCACCKSKIYFPRREEALSFHLAYGHEPIAVENFAHLAGWSSGVGVLQQEWDAIVVGDELLEFSKQSLTMLGRQKDFF